MARLHPGWLIAACAAGLAVSCWLPWLTTSADGGGRVSAIGGTQGGVVLPGRFGAGQLITLLASVLIVLGALAARDFSRRAAAVAAVVVSLLAGGLTWWYFHTNVAPPVDVGYGLYVGAAFVAGAFGCAVWAVASSVIRR